MAVSRKGRCLKTSFDRVILCAGTMTDWIEIVKREIQTSEPGYNGETEVFTSVANYPGRIEALKYTTRFDGTTITDTSGSSFTHVVYIPFDQTVYELDLGSLWVKISRTKDRYLKLTGGIKDVYEQEQYLELALIETGFTENQASLG